MADYTEAQLRVIAKLGDLRQGLAKVNQQIQSCNRRIMRINNERQRHQDRKGRIKADLAAIAKVLEVEKEVRPSG